MSDFLCADWLRAMVNTSTDHENNVMVVQILFLHAWLSHWGQRKWTQKMSTAMLLKKQITSHYPWSILLKRLLKWHQNVQNFAVKPFTCSSIVDKSTVWPWKTVDGLLNHVEMYSTSQREANCAIHWKEICPGDIDIQLLNTWPWLFKCWIAWTLSTA